MSIYQKLFTPTFWTDELLDARNAAIELGHVLLLYMVGLFLVNQFSARVANALVAGQRRLGIIHDESVESRRKTLNGLIRSVGHYALFFVFIILALRALGFDAVSVVTSASVAGVAFGFGAQKLVKDVISGFFIIVENQYVVGDYVTINGISGSVEDIGMRIVKVRDDSGKLYIFANGDITSVCNQSRGAISMVVEFGIPPGTEMLHVSEAINSAGKEVFENRKDLGFTKPPEFQGIGGGDSTRTVVRAIVQVNDPANLAVAGVALRDNAHAKLLATGITPF